MFYTYILKSESSGKYYYGQTKDLQERLRRHNKGLETYTRGKGPWVLHHVETFDTRAEAVRRELFFKSVDGYRYLREVGIIV